LEAFSSAESFTLGVVYASLNRTTRLVQFGADAAMQLAAMVAKVEKMVRSDPELTGYLYRQWVMEPPAAEKGAHTEA
jgi:lauroyl/myristoyl acyltransferase